MRKKLQDHCLVFEYVWIISAWLATASSTLVTSLSLPRHATPQGWQKPQLLPAKKCSILWTMDPKWGRTSLIHQRHGTDLFRLWVLEAKRWKGYCWMILDATVWSVVTCCNTWESMRFYSVVNRLCDRHVSATAMPLFRSEHRFCGRTITSCIFWSSEDMSDMWSKAALGTLQTLASNLNKSEQAILMSWNFFIPFSHDVDIWGMLQVAEVRS